MKPRVLSLFDGSGCWQLAAEIVGFEAKYASEIEKFPIEVTKKNFPGMIHLGDVTKIKGDEIEPCEIICAGSPCQDLSIAGKRAGLKGERSGLFMEVIRIIKEMRRKTNGQYPKLAFWENVCGSFSSNGGKDFQAVIEEYIHTVDPAAVIPGPPFGQWSNSGVVGGDGYQLAYRVLDAQFWGVAQRRRRVFIVFSLTDERASEILFKRPGLRRNFKESLKERQRAAGRPESSIGETGEIGGMSVWGENVTPPMVASGTTAVGNTQDGLNVMTYQKTTGPLMASGYSKNGTQEAANDMYVAGEAYGISRQAWTSGEAGADTFPLNIQKEVEPCLLATGEHGVAHTESLDVYHLTTEEEKAHVLKARDYKDPQVVFRKTGHPTTSDGGQGWEETEVADTLNVFDNTEARTPTLCVRERESNDRKADRNRRIQDGQQGFSDKEEGLHRPLRPDHGGETWLLSQNGHHTHPYRNVAGTLNAIDWKDPPIVTEKKDE